MEHLVGLINGLRVRGVNPAAGTCDWRKIPFTPNNARGVMAQRVMPLHEALETRWTSDMFSVMYVMHDAEGEPLPKQPRLTKSGLSWVESQGFSVLANVLTAEFDNEGKAPWTEEAQLAQLERMERHDLLRASVWYFTPGGWRGHWKLSRKVRAGVELEMQVEALLLALESIGLAPDWQCVDWTRVQRLPWVERGDGKIAHQTPWGDGIEIDPFNVSASAKRIGAARSARSKKIRCPEGMDFATTLEGAWVARAGVVAEALREEYAQRNAGWHDVSLCLPGAMLEVGVDPALVVALSVAIAVGASSDEYRSSAARDARTTIERARAGEPVRGANALEMGWPATWAALRSVCSAKSAGGAPELPSIDEAAQVIQRALRDAPDGVSIISAGCGVGKTFNTETVAIERAARSTGGKRASKDTRTAISVPTNKLAIQIAANVKRRGARVLRVFSPPSELGPDGKPYCRYAAQARHLADGGVSIGFEYCRGGGDARRECPELHHCPAADGQTGDADALIVVGNHGLLSRVLATAGVTGLKVIDEPPAILRTFVLDAQSFAMFDALSDALHPSDREAITGIVDAIRVLLDELVPDFVFNLSECVTEEMREVARAVDLRRGPPLRAGEAFRSKSSEGYARDLGRMCKVAMYSLLAMRSTMPVVARVECRNERRILKITLVNDDAHEALRTEGRTVLLDAAPDYEVLERAVGYKLDGRTTRVEARDGAPVERVHLRWTRGARRHLIGEDNKIETGRLKSALRAAFAWLAESPDTRSAGLITFLPIRQLLDGAMRGPGSDAWKLAVSRYSADAVGDIRDFLCQQSFVWPGNLDLGHFGALRGLDDWKGCDAIVTLGDPWQNVGDVANDAAYLGEDPKLTRRHEWLARAELEQAQGRLRAPSRSKPGRALHIGALLPFGALWQSPEVRVLPDGRPVAHGRVSVEELRAWVATFPSLRAAAEAAGITHVSLSYALRGIRPVPAKADELVRSGNKSALSKVSVKTLLLPPDESVREGDLEDEEAS